jgi:hypothetical protein
MRAEKTFSGTGNLTIETLGKREVFLDIGGGAHTATTVLEFSTDNFTTVETVPMLKTDGTFVTSSANTVQKVRASIPSDPGGKIRSRISAFTSGTPKHILTLR